MATTVNKNLLDLALRGQLIDAKIHLSDKVKTVSEFVDYDSMTHTFTLKFTNGDVQEISDKIKFTVEISDFTPRQITKKRAKK